MSKFQIVKTLDKNNNEKQRLVHRKNIHKPKCIRCGNIVRTVYIIEKKRQKKIGFYCIICEKFFCLVSNQLKFSVRSKEFKSGLKNNRRCKE